MKKIAIVVTFICVIIATLLCLNSCMNIYASNATENQTDSSDTSNNSEVRKNIVQEDANAMLEEIVTTKKIYDSSTIKVEKKESVSIEEIQTIIDEFVKIYNNYDEIKLSNFENRQAVAAGFLESYKKYLSDSISLHSAGGVYNSSKEKVDKLKSDLRKIENSEELDTVIIDSRGVAYSTVMEYAKEGFVITPDKRIINGEYYDVYYYEYVYNYEEVITSMLIDRLMSILPKENFTLYNYDNCIERNTDQYGVDILLDSSGEKQLRITFSDSAVYVGFSVKNGEEIESIYPFKNTTELAKQLCRIREPIASDYDRVPEKYYQEAIAGYEKWKQRVEQYKQNKNIVK